MPQLNKGGKYVFGISIIGNGNRVQIPEQTLSEYGVDNEQKVIIFTGSKITGGFCVTTEQLLSNSKLKHILAECPGLVNGEIREGEFIRYKGRGYAWAAVSQQGIIQLTDRAMQYLNLSVGDSLMSIRSSDIAFTMGAKGPLMEKARSYSGEIKKYTA